MSNPSQPSQFRPNSTDGGFKPTRIRDQKNSPFYYNPSRNNSNPNLNDKNSIAPSNLKSSNSNDTIATHNNYSNSNNNNNSTHNNDSTINNNKTNDVKKPPLQCPICNEKKFNYYSECLFHIILKHDHSQSKFTKYIVNDCQCKFCQSPLNEDDEIIILHMYENHRKELFNGIIEGNFFQKKYTGKLKSYFRQFANFEDEKRVISKKINEKIIQKYIEEEEDKDEDYVNFIASSITTKGISTQEQAQIHDVQPISEPNQKQEAEVIDHNFWVKLNNIADKLTASGNIEVNENKYQCCLCNEKFKTHVKLLSHCWNEHQNVL